MTTKSLPPEMVSVCDQMHAEIVGELSRYLEPIRQGMARREKEGLILDEAQGVATLSCVIHELIEVAPNTAAGILALLLHRLAAGDLKEKNS